MPSASLTSGSTEPEPPLPRPTVVAGSRPSSRASSKARSTYSSAASSRSASPAQQSARITRNRSVGTSGGPFLRSTGSASQEAGPSSTSASHAGPSRPTTQTAVRTAVDVDEIVEISSDSSDDDEIVALGPDPVRRPQSSGYEVASVRRAAPAVPPLRSDLFFPPPPMGRPADTLFFDSNNRGGRMQGVSADPYTGDFLTRPMPIVRPRSSTSHSDPDGSFTIVSAQTVPQPSQPQRSEHPITDQRLRSTNLAMPRLSPPRSKPPPIEHPLLSTYNCPICFDAPKNLVVTPCGHFFCGECLFQALKTQTVQRGAMEEEESFLGFNLFAPFAPAGTFGAGRGSGAAPGGSGPDNGGRGGRGGAAAGAGHGRGGSGRGGGPGAPRGRNKPDPLAGQCPVCRAKIKGAFNGREKNGILGLRLTVGKPIDDPREESGKMKTTPTKEDAGSVSSSELSEEEDEEMVLPTNKKEETHDDEKVAMESITDVSPKAARGKKQSSTVSVGSDRRSPRTQAGGGDSRKRQREASENLDTQTE